MKPYLRLLHYAWRYRGRLVLSVVCVTLAAGLNAVSLAGLQPAFDSLFGQTSGVSLPPGVARLLGDLPARWAVYAQANRLAVLLGIAAFVLGVFVLRSVFTFINAYLMRWVAERIQADLRREIYSHLHTLSLSFFTRMSTGEVMTRTVGDPGIVGNSVVDLFRNGLREPLTMMSLAGLLFLLSWKLALLSLVVFPLALYPILQFGRRMRKRGGQLLQRATELAALVQETVAGIRIVKAFAMEDYERERFRQQNERVFRAIIRTNVVDSLTHPVMETLGAFGVALTIALGGYSVLSGTLTPGAFVTFLAALGSFYQPLRRVSQLNNTVQQGIAALERIFSLLDTRSEVVEAPDAVRLPPLGDRIVFEEVGFAYETDPPVLDRVSFEAKLGELVAIVGPSGAGKTTLVNLIPRFYDPTRGRILIDGMDIRGATLPSLRGQMGIVTQETILFDDTVYNNIAYGRRDVPPAQVEQAARLANAHEFILGMPDGYQTRIGERGVRLSGGQRQRLAIARAILKDPPILILDEATSSLDAESERLVQEALDRVMEHRTAFVIAHRLSTILRADKILVLKDGVIVESGTHSTLLARRGVYAQLYEVQLRAADAAP
jgi:subfamily B ATP-binding cassette protein MsbA